MFAKGLLKVQMLAAKSPTQQIALGLDNQVENLEPQSHLCPRGRATRMVATSSKVSTSIPKPIDIAVTMLLLVYLLFIGMSLSLSTYISKEIRL